MFCVMPGTIWGVRYALAPHTVLVEGMSVRQAFARSAALTRGKKFRIFLYACGVGFLFACSIMLPLSVMTSLLVGVLSQSLYTGFWAQGIYMGAQLMQTFYTTIWQVLFVIFNVLLFKSLRLVPGQS
jgi:hypothetical protein